MNCLGRSVSQTKLSVWSLNTCQIYQHHLSTLGRSKIREGRSSCVREVELRSAWETERTHRNQHKKLRDLNQQAEFEVYVKFKILYKNRNLNTYNFLNTTYIYKYMYNIIT
jgi:hypothetical protein